MSCACDAAWFKIIKVPVLVARVLVLIFLSSPCHQGTVRGWLPLLLLKSDEVTGPQGLMQGAKRGVGG